MIRGIRLRKRSCFIACIALCRRFKFVIGSGRLSILFFSRVSVCF